uniref:PGG domain-containing protein n=1 Tax=Oryza meridionalis TaxID=40149 RepID=A0A0E0F4A7_9ORYZ
MDVMHCTMPFALELIAAEADLSQGVNKYGESPMYIAVMRDFTDIFQKLLGIPGSAHVGCNGRHALHAAVRNGNPVIAKELVEKRPELAREFDNQANTPMHLTAIWGKTEVLGALLQNDWSLGYAFGNNCAAYRGYVSVARELLHHCPDAPYCYATGWTCLHQATSAGHLEFVEFILESPYLRKLVNMRDGIGNTALHYAVQRCNPRVVAALLSHGDTDITVLNNTGDDAVWELYRATNYAKTLNWNEVSMRLLKADPQNATSIYNLHKVAKDKLNKSSMEDAKSLTRTYTSNTSLVAILIATITFAAAFTLPGGYSNDASNEGYPVMARKFSFQAFLIADTLAMCSSLAVAFICIVARWEDLQFLLHYRSFTKKLMWFAYMATTVAFATGLYTVLAPQLQWLAVGICLVPALLPAITKLLGEWPVLKLRFRLGKTFNSDLLNMV